MGTDEVVGDLEALKLGRGGRGAADTRRRASFPGSPSRQPLTVIPFDGRVLHTQAYISLDFLQHNRRQSSVTKLCTGCVMVLEGAYVEQGRRG
jgi:hypothetical protein